MNKKLPVMPAAARELETARVATLSVRPDLPLAELQGAIKEGLMAFSCATGLVVIAEMMQEEVARVVGPKGRHDPARVAERNGSAPGSVVLGARTVPVRRPRAVRTDGGGEVGLDTYAVFSSADLLTQVALERMLAGVAARRHGLVAEPIGEALEAVARGGSKSAVSRRFKAATEAKLAELVARDLSELDVAAMMIDGIVFAECCIVVALAITTNGTKVPVGLWEGDTENSVVVTDLLADLVSRGLGCEAGVLFVLDGSKALAGGVKRVFGDRALIQRCVLHKRRINRPSGVESSNYPLASCRRSPARWRSMLSATRSWRAASSLHPRVLASSRRTRTSSSCSLSSWARSGSGTKLSHCSQMLAYAQAPATGSREQNPWARRVLSISAWSQSTLDGTDRLLPAAMTNSERRPLALAMAVL